MPSNALAVVGSQIITSERFEEELARRARLAPGRFTEPAAKQALLDELIQFEALYEQARKAGYETNAELLASFRRMVVGRFRESRLPEQEPFRPSAAEIEQYYRNNLDRFGAPAKVHGALIEIRVARTASTEKRDELARKAEALLAEARTNAIPDRSFGLLAARHSEHQPSRYRGGDIGWLTVGVTDAEWPPEVVEALFKLSEPGQLAPVVSTPTAFYLVRLMERQPAQVRPLEEVRDGVEYLVAREKEQRREEEFYAAMKQGLEIRVNQERLASIALPSHQIRPPPVPGGASPGEIQP